METKPTHEQAQLHLQVYEMRREAKLRQGREWFFKNYIVQNLDDAMRIAGPGSENGALSMMVLSYWEQALRVAQLRSAPRRPVLSDQRRIFGVWEMAKPIVPQSREKLANKQFLVNLEKSSAAVRDLDRKPVTGSHRCHASVHETDALSGGISSESLNRSPA